MNGKFTFVRPFEFGKVQFFTWRDMQPSAEGLPRLELSISALAAAHETSENAIRKSLGGARVYATSRSGDSMALEVARASLARNAQNASSLSAISLVAAHSVCTSLAR